MGLQSLLDNNFDNKEVASNKNKLVGDKDGVDENPFSHWMTWLFP